MIILPLLFKICLWQVWYWVSVRLGLVSVRKLTQLLVNICEGDGAQGTRQDVIRQCGDDGCFMVSRFGP